MLEYLKIGIIRLLKKFRYTSTIYGLHQLTKKGYLADQGWAQSWYEKKAIDKNGNPIPWLTYPCIDFLKGRVTKNMDVFEYGTGASTLWFSGKSKSVFSCEHNEEWYRRMEKKTKSLKNVDLKFEPLSAAGNYESTIQSLGRKFNIVLIDGRNRNKCAVFAIQAVTEDGVIIWDNSDRKEYLEGLEYVETSGFRRLDFFGPAPGSFRGSCTSIFYRTKNCLGL